jgi:hypothetical protein
MKVQNGWIFGPKADFVAFAGPVLASLALLFFNIIGWLEPNTGANKSPGNHFYIIQTYINLAHLYSTFWYTYAVPSEWRTHRRYFISIPIILLVMNIFAAFAGDRIYVHMIFAHFTIWHFIKQQQAWFHISAHRGAPRDAFTVRIDNICIVGATLGFALASQCGESALGWFMKNDLIELPAVLRVPLSIFSISCVAFYFIWHGVRLCQKKSMNWFAHFLFFVAAAIWSFRLYKPPSDLRFYIGQLFHAVPYFVLGYRYMVAKRAAGETYLFPKAPVWLLGIAIFILAGQQGHLEMNLRFQAAFSEENLQNMQMIFTSAFFNSLNITHYVIDMFFWNRKNNPGWVKALA